MAIPKEIVGLVERFTRNREAYKTGNYNETQLRREFLDPFFKALGWDIDNENSYAEGYKDVIHEDAIKVGEATKAPDYCFRIGGTRKFFLEAKKPAVDIKNDVGPAFQLRRYAWTTKLPLSILSDFEEFAVYDCRFKPDQKDSAAVARILYIPYTEYVARWDEIADIFSRDAVLKGSFDKYAESSKAKRGTADVDDEFLQTIETWRKELAENLALRNKKLSQRELNFAVQRIIDRIIFLRICEGRGIEDYGRLRSLAGGDRIYQRLSELFEQADDRYNSGLFHFKAEKGRHEPPDDLTLSLDLDDKLLRGILKNLYYPESPYVFSALPADVLGQVYEQFLGKVIRLTDGHHAKVDDKPEVKIAEGVFYTPTYIVEYIVQNTLGKLLEGKNSKQAAKLKILDPACGSGSFLLGAYEHLLKWHLDFYTKNDSIKWAKGNKPVLVQSSAGNWKLTIAERKRILLDNIYGVDIDAQAVETTKLSLLLKVLEGETNQTIQPELLYERALPDLGNNIKCGNSLIGPDYYNQQEMTLIDDDERHRINVFDWHVEFPQIFQRKSYTGELHEAPPASPSDYTMPGIPLHGSYNYKKLKNKKSVALFNTAELAWDGGFDAVIGNPPYGFHQIHNGQVKNYFKSHYAVSDGSFEHYFLFYEASLKKLAVGGYLGFIVPVTWLTIPSASALRKFVLDNFSINSIAWLPELVFKNAQVNTLVSIIQRAKSELTKILISEVNNPGLNQGIQTEIEQTKFISAGYVIRIFESSRETAILENIESNCVSLSNLARPCSGYNPYEVGAGLGLNGKPQTKETVESRPYHSETKHGGDWKPEAGGRDLGRYTLNWPKNRFIKYGNWLAAPRDPKNFIGPRLLVQEITGGKNQRIIATFCEKELYYSRDIIPIKCELAWPSPLFLLGIINSWLITWRHHRRSPKAKKALFPKVLVGDLKLIPVPKLSSSNSADKLRHNQIAKLVEQALEFHKKMIAARTPLEKASLERQISAIDTQIDRLVYDLYGLTEDEIKIVEDSRK